MKGLRIGFSANRSGPFRVRHQQLSLLCPSESFTVVNLTLSTPIALIMFARSILRSAQPMKSVCFKSAPTRTPIFHSKTPRRDLLTDEPPQSLRRYATDSPQAPQSNGSRTAIFAGLAIAAGAGGYYYYGQPGAAPSSSTSTSSPAAEAPPSKDEEKTIPASTNKSAAFTGGDQGWVDLKLESVEQVSHNTKKFRFALPDKDDVSGLQIACQLTLLLRLHLTHSLILSV